MNKNDVEKLRNKLQEAVDSGKTQSQISEASGVQQGSISRFLKGQQDSFSGDGTIKLLNYVGAKIVFPGESADGGPCSQCDFLRARITKLEAANEALENAIAKAMRGGQAQAALDSAPQVKALPEGKERVS